MSSASEEEAEDVFSSSLLMLFDYAPITHANAGATFSYQAKSMNFEGQEISGLSAKLRVPDTLAKNNALHASSIWSSALYLADHLSDLGILTWIKEHVAYGRQMDVLELGAGAGLPGIVLAKLLERSAGHDVDWRVTLSDYPDESIVSTLRQNLVENGLSDERCTVSAYDWGADVSPILARTNRSNGSGFDLIVAADTLWNTDLHAKFLFTLKSLLRRNASAQAHLVAGFHTGRFSIQRFLDTIASQPLQSDFGKLEVVRLEERLTASSSSTQDRSPKAWDPNREDYDEKERRKWLVCIVLRWSVVEGK